MTHFIKVSIVIVLVTIVFFNSSVIENIVDPSYNEYDYLRKFRRTHNVVENDKYLNNITPNVSTESSNLPHIFVTNSNSESNILTEPNTTNATNILPYVLLLLLIIIISIIVYIKYH